MEIDHILGGWHLRARKFFNEVQVEKFFHLATIAAVLLAANHLIRTREALPLALDSLLLRMPLLKWQAWIVVFSMSAPLR